MTDRTVWIDTHCHLDASEFLGQASVIRARAAAKNVAHCVYPAVHPHNFADVRKLAHDLGDSYALGIHPWYVKDAQEQDLHRLDDELASCADDARLVAVGEIGLDFSVPEFNRSPLRDKQIYFYLAQLQLARQHDLPVILHVRRSADLLLKGLRDIAGPASAWHGIAHAFNGSEQQARAFIKLGFKLGFGGALTYERALQLRRLATTLPLAALVLETDAPDMPPHWLYKTAAQREAGEPQGRNEPAELPRIAQALAELRGIDMAILSQACLTNALDALPKIKALLFQPAPLQ